MSKKPSIDVNDTEQISTASMETKTTESEAVEPKLLPLEQREEYRRRLLSVWEHTEGVRNAACKLATRMIDNASTEGELDLARRLLQRAMQHDHSKFQGIEWQALHRDCEDEALMVLARTQHQQSNDHHPEYYADSGIRSMNDVQIAEMVCDWFVRSSEMGTNLRDFIKDDATVRWKFSTKTKVYQRIKRFVDLLLDPTFK